MTDKFKIIDLFSGCGGFSQGFLKAGFEVIAASEFWQPAIETYKFNHTKTKMIEGDIRDPEKKQELYQAVEGKEVNVIIGGPPCQGYSIAGNRDPNDPRGELYLDYIEIVNHIKPDFFVMENVKGLLNMQHVNPHLSESELKDFKDNAIKLQRYKDLRRYSAQRELNEEEKNEFKFLTLNVKEISKELEKGLYPLIEKILDKFKEINFKVSWKVLNSADYGVPQTRERIIFIGTKYNNLKIQFPREKYAQNTTQKSLDTFFEEGSKKKKWLTSSQALKKYEDWPENVEKSHVFTNHSDKFLEKINSTKPGENVFEKYTDSFWRLDPRRPARTVKENHGGVFVHYKFNRVCTPRELAVLQSFDDDFLFKGSKSAILKEIGNAVPPLMAKIIALEVKSALNKLKNNS